MDIFKQLSSQKKKLDYTRNVFKKIKENIGINTHIRKYNINYYEFLYELINLHPNYDNKIGVKIITDFYIRYSAMNKTAFELVIVFDDNTEDVVSWNCCCTGRKHNVKHRFNEALRQCVDSQILEFKNNNDIFKCWNCNCDLNDKFHIDHIILFKDLVNQFIKEYNIEIPLKYDKEEKIFRSKFKKKDEKLSQLFYDYHKEKAILKPSCIQCNLKRSKK